MIQIFLVHFGGQVRCFPVWAKRQVELCFPHSSQNRLCKFKQVEVFWLSKNTNNLLVCVIYVSKFFRVSSFCYIGHFAAEDVKTKLNELNQKWDSLKAKASQRRQDLEDSLQAQQYFADANEAESWMREKEPIVGSTDYGKDEDSAEVFDIV